MTHEFVTLRLSMLLLLQLLLMLLATMDGDESINNRLLNLTVLYLNNIKVYKSY